MHIGDSPKAEAGRSGEGPQISGIVSGDEATCWAAIEHWPATHQLQAGEHAEVHARSSEARQGVSDDRDRIVDERDDVADEQERDLDRRQAELRRLLEVLEAESAAAVTRTRELVEHARGAA